MRFKNTNQFQGFWDLLLKSISESKCSTLSSLLLVICQKKVWFLYPLSYMIVFSPVSIYVILAQNTITIWSTFFFYFNWDLSLIWAGWTMSAIPYDTHLSWVDQSWYDTSTQNPCDFESMWFWGRIKCQHVYICLSPNPRSNSKLSYPCIELWNFILSQFFFFFLI